MLRNLLKWHGRKLLRPSKKPLKPLEPLEIDTYGRLIMPESELFLKGLPTSEAAREFLLIMGEGNAYAFWKLWRRFKKVTSYKAICSMFYVLREIGLIESVRYAPSKFSGFKKHFFRVKPGMEDSPKWRNPQAELYPDVRLGGSGYAELKKLGLKPKGGRALKYRK